MSSVAQQNIQFIDLGAQQARIRERIETRIKAVLDHGSYIMGPEVRELEAALAAFVGVKHAISCSSGTDALLMALMAKGVGAGDVIFTTPFTFIATAEVIALLGAHTVFVDIDADTYNMSAAALETTIADYVKKHGSDKLKGVIPVDLFGQPADYDEIEAVATRYGMAVWEDAAQSFGATYKGKRSCSIGEMGCTSFFPAKPLGCYGDGGAVFTNDDQLAEKLVSIRVHGKGGHKYDNVRIGINGRLDTLQAAILLEKLAVFEEEIELRDQVAARYSAALAGRFVVPAVREDRTSVWAQYSILSENREADMARLKAKGIPTAVYYPKPLHLQDAFADLGYIMGDFPVTEKMMTRIFSLPMHPYLSTDEQDYIIRMAIEG
ncbi:MAG TPA: DegT/DnrJ/EryC1/StrS family aminotransferase [Calditrichia bacterium]|nr:DegT/DnrJ/EryC1/StrS family aminotransferase [Calditrichia bacterium]